MAKTLGRNPFEKKKQQNSSKEDISKPASWVLVDLPAKTCLFALKTIGLAKAALSKSRNTAS